MSWPLASHFSRMLQNPAVAFRDPELQQCQVEKDALNQPKPRSGTFAVVFKGTTFDGSRSFAIRCFTTKSPERRERYHRVSEHLSTQPVSCLVDFEYRDQSIRSAGDGKWYPLVVMDWVEGQTLFHWIPERAAKRDQEALLLVALRWAGLVKELAEARIAHGDLQHANVMVTPNSDLKLVDYDGMCVPALVGRRNLEMGVESYQHPARDQDTQLSLDLDNFSALMIYVALRALAADPGLWEKHVQKPRYDKLLFKPSDFAEPHGSQLIEDLRNSPHAEVATLTETLLEAWAGDMHDVPPLTELGQSYLPPCPGRSLQETRVPSDTRRAPSAWDTLSTPALASAVEAIESAASSSSLASQQPPPLPRVRWKRLRKPVAISAVVLATLPLIVVMGLRMGRIPGAYREGVPPPPPPWQPLVPVSQVEDAQRQNSSEAAVADQLVRQAVFAPPRSLSVESVAQDSALRPVGRLWSEWGRGREMLARYLAARPKALTKDSERLTALTAIREEYKTTPPAGSEDFMHALDEEIVQVIEERLRTKKGIDRWQEAYAIRMEYPTDVVEDMLRETAEKWLSEGIREKKSGEPPKLEEVTVKGQTGDKLRIYRGYFKEVAQGYKRYPTPEERDNPKYDVGTIRTSDIASGPEPPTAERCVQTYNGDIKALLRRPHDRSKWEKFVELCDELDQKLADYRQIPGHGEVDVSFQQEADFARQLLNDQTWPKVETLLRQDATPPKPSSQR